MLFVKNCKNKYGKKRSNRDIKSVMNTKAEISASEDKSVNQ